MGPNQLTTVDNATSVFASQQKISFLKEVLCGKAHRQDAASTYPAKDVLL